MENDKIEEIKNILYKYKLLDENYNYILENYPLLGTKINEILKKIYSLPDYVFEVILDYNKNEDLTLDILLDISYKINKDKDKILVKEYYEGCIYLYISNYELKINEFKLTKKYPNGLMIYEKE